MTRRTPQNPLIDSALRAIADGAPLPWRELDNADADPAKLDVLRTLDAIASAYNANTTAAAPSRSPLFRWGALDVEESLGQGSSGDVYRAFDPWLGRHVALKLFRDFDNASGLDEARRLARLRHRNVLSVYGCGVHDERAGLWSELIEGATLSKAVTTDGAFSAEEAARIGRDLAQALAVVHAAGLVHGDVKAENVMRESGGRIVLMDFGAGGDARLLAGQRLISGTPRYLPPDVLDGAPLGTASDIYALGVLLHFLLTGRHPYQSTDPAALREEQRRNDRPPLNTLRPDADARLCALVESCLAADPRQRPDSAATLAQKFAEIVHARESRASRRLPLVALAAACAALICVGTLLLWPRFAPPPWESSANFLRVEPSGNVEIAANDTLRVGDRLRLTLHSSRDTWVYVLNEDAAGNATVLFPLSAAQSNPLHGGTTLTLPGGTDATLAWEVTAESAREEFVVISSLAPLAEIERDLADWKRARPADDERAVGAVVDAPALQLHGDHLRRILAALAHDTAHVRVWQYSFAHRG